MKERGERREVARVYHPGRLEGWKAGRLEGWKAGRLEGVGRSASVCAVVRRGAS
ncbi:hypothetical protein DP43_5828 [Burkholderia pseudomallei]|nr:hypothetical protein DP43_5828 [Burkholderia pseudomallei]